MAYSYNGYVYPQLPSGYDQYPYAIIAGDTLRLSKQPFVAVEANSGVFLLGTDGKNGVYYVYFKPIRDSHWDRWSAEILSAGRVIAGSSDYVWANYDFCDRNGNVVLAASDPVPVGLTIRCPDSVTQGLFIGIACDSLDEKYVDFTCELSGNTSPQTRLIQYNSYTARLECAKDEAAGSLTITVASVDDPGLTGTKDIAVVPRDWTYPDDDDPGSGGGGGGGGWDETSLVTGIDLHVYPETVVPGGRATVEVSVNGIGNYSQAFTARLSGNSSPETELFSAGYSCNVWIAEEETAEYVLVTVASVQDPTITATEMIYIDYSGTEDEGTTQQQLQRAFWKGFAAARAYFQEAKVSASASIHIAREEAEPTTKAGKLRRSFWQGFVSALIVAAAETAPETVPEGVLISLDGYILTDCNGVYLIAAVDAEPDEPDEPGEVATMYLYGTPSESGNIGLRVGDTVTYYDGAVATAYPEWDSVPYVAITKTDRYDCIAEYSSCPIVWVDEDTLGLAGEGTNRMYNTDVFKDGVWLVREPMENTLNSWGEPLSFPLDYGKILWSNHDIKNSSETEVMFVKSPDPIPIYNGIVEYINGIPIYE
jgi:hypothetical protein